MNDNQELPAVIRVKLEMEYYPRQEPEAWEMMSLRQIIAEVKQSYIVDLDGFSNVEELYDSLEVEVEN